MRNLGILGSKKGQFTSDIIYFVIFFFILIIAVIAGKWIVGELNDVSEELPITDEAKQLTTDIDEGYIPFWDGIMLFAFIFLILAMFFTSYMIDTYPFFFVITLFVVIVFTLGVMLLRNVFFDLMAGDTFGGEASNFVIIPFLMENIVSIMIVVSFITAVILFAKWRGGGA